MANATTWGVEPSRPFVLDRAYPNPFRTSTMVSFTVQGGPKNVDLAIYDIQGRLVRTLLKEEKSPGTYDLPWDGRNDAGARVSAGLYLLRARVDGREEKGRRLMLLP